MRTIIRRKRSLKKNTRGLSNIIVVVLSLIIIVVIVSNVILWSYQMNQLDWEKMQERVNIIDAGRLTRSFWSMAEGEYGVNKGNQIGGSFLDTQTPNDKYEIFGESFPPCELDITAAFSIDLSLYQSAQSLGIEVQLRYRAYDSGEKWFLKAYNWTARTYSDEGFNTTAGQTPQPGWNLYAVNFTGNWRSYVQDDGKVLIKVHDQFPDGTRTSIDVDFLGVRAVINGSSFTFQNSGTRTVHIVSIWIENSTAHFRHDADVFVNSGETCSYSRVDIQLPTEPYMVKVVTERGNSAVYIVD